MLMRANSTLTSGTPMLQGNWNMVYLQFWCIMEMFWIHILYATDSIKITSQSPSFCSTQSILLSICAVWYQCPRGLIRTVCSRLKLHFILLLLAFDSYGYRHCHLQRSLYYRTFLSLLSSCFCISVFECWWYWRVADKVFSSTFSEF